MGLYKDEFEKESPEVRIVRMMQSWVSLPLVTTLDVLLIPVVLVIVFPLLYVYFIYVFFAALFKP